MTAEKISLCMIVRNAEESLAACLDSAVDHVDEVVIVDTGSTDATPEIARRYANVFEIFIGCNDADGNILDFSLARNRSLELATNDWILWLDSDDILHEGRHLRQLVKEEERIRLRMRGLADGPRATRYLMRYAYAPGINQWRERLVGPRGAFQWQGPVHESLFAKAGEVPQDAIVEAIWVEHTAHALTRTPRDSGRNLRILDAYIRKVGEGDPRALFYYGSELAANGRSGEGIRHIRRAVEIETWVDQKAMGQIQLAELYAAMGDHELAVDWALKALTTKSWPAPWYRLARSFYSLAVNGEQPEYNFRRAVNFARHGIQARQYNPPQLLLENVKDHGEIWKVLNVCLYSTGYLEEALAACEQGLKELPDDEDLQNNLRAYKERMVAKVGVPQVTQPRREMPVGKLDIVLFTGEAYERWDPETIAENGIGGSETMAWEVARRLVRMGHRVRLFGDPPAPSEVEGVDFQPWQAFSGVECDVLISSRRADAVDDVYGCRALAYILWVHDVVAPGLDLKRLSRFDSIWCLSEWHKRFLGRYLPDTGKLTVIRNGIDTTLIEQLAYPESIRVSHRAIYSSSPDRGLECALDCWGRVRDWVPNAELHVFYGFDLYDAVAPDASARLRAKMEETTGVVYHGRVAQHALLSWMRTSGVWAYPTWEWAGPGAGETSCITAMQAQACGCWPVTTRIAALAETVTDGWMLDGDGLSPEYKASWVNAMVEAMTTRSDRSSMMESARSRFSLDSLVEMLGAQLVGLATRNRECVTPEYRPVRLPDPDDIHFEGDGENLG